MDTLKRMDVEHVEVQLEFEIYIYIYICKRVLYARNKSREVIIAAST